jgi:hypothetical protein
LKQQWIIDKLFYNRWVYDEIGISWLMDKLID